jgi:hypothetical protein
MTDCAAARIRGVPESSYECGTVRGEPLSGKERTIVRREEKGSRSHFPRLGATSQRSPSRSAAFLAGPQTSICSRANSKLDEKGNLRK